MSFGGENLVTGPICWDTVNSPLHPTLIETTYWHQLWLYKLHFLYNYAERKILGTYFNRNWIHCHMEQSSEHWCHLVIVVTMLVPATKSALSMCSGFKDYSFTINSWSVFFSDSLSVEHIFWTWVAPRPSRTERQHGNCVILHNQNI